MLCYVQVLVVLVTENSSLPDHECVSHTSLSLTLLSIVVAFCCFHPRNDGMPQGVVA
jgi:hypothetical protein